MVAINSDIEKFNLYVDSQVASLAARGESTQDLLPNLFKGYKAASDKKFVAYIEKKEEDYDDGEAMTAEHVMELALNKFKVRKEANTWNAPTEEEEKIFALEAEIKKLKSSSKKPTPKKGSTGAQKDASKCPTKRGGSRKKPAWMLANPKAGDPSTKTVDGKQYHWCPKHKLWTLHKPEECRGINV
jgi:hypothetical protein